MSYHEEQETLESLKAWWAKWGNALTWAVLAVLVVLAAWSGWTYWQRRQTAEAAVLYEQLQQAAVAHDLGHVRRVTSDMQKSFGRTPYAQMSSLGAATVLYAGKDVDGAKADLQWVLDHGTDPAYKQIAAIRLAGILMDQKAYDAGLALLGPAGDDKQGGGFAALRADRRGDLYVAAGKPADARGAYRDALKLLATDDASMRQLVQFKLDALGG